MKYFSMFSGIGGFEFGIENSNVSMESIGHCEVDKYAESIFSLHFPKSRNWGDATEIKTEELPEFDFLVGGFPCQAFSLAGKRKGFNDTRGTLFFEIARILKDKRPKYFLFENVKGLLSHDGGRTFKRMLGILSELGYNVKWEILNSKDFSLPQNRERVFIEGYLGRECGREVLSFRDPSRKADGELDWRYTGVRSGRLINPNKGQNNGGSLYVPIEHKIERQVTKRVYPVDMDKLSEFLRNAKSKSGLSIKEIADAAQVKQSVVEHWFRTDEWQSIPIPSEWLKLKGVLNLDDSFDKEILTWETVDGKYDMSKRAYDVDGVSATVTTNEQLIRLNDSEIQSQTVYDADGVACSLSANGGGQGGKTGLYKVYGSMQKHRAIKVGNINPNKPHQSGDVYDVDGIGRTLTATDGSHPHLICENEIRVVDNVSPTGHRGDDVFDENGISRTLTYTNYKHPLKVRTNTNKGYDEAYPNDGVRLCHPSSTTNRGRVHKGETGALSCATDWGTVDKNYRIRRLTPTECERLQGFPDRWTKYGKDGELISDTQRYKCLGNAVSTTVITYLINRMFDKDESDNDNWSEEQ